MNFIPYLGKIDLTNILILFKSGSVPIDKSHPTQFNERGAICKQEIIIGKLTDIYFPVMGLRDLTVNKMNNGGIVLSESDVVSDVLLCTR